MQWRQNLMSKSKVWGLIIACKWYCLTYHCINVENLTPNLLLIHQSRIRHWALSVISVYDHSIFTRSSCSDLSAISFVMKDDKPASKYRLGQFRFGTNLLIWRFVMSFSTWDQKINSFDSKINVNVPPALCENMSLDKLFTAIPILIQRNRFIDTRWWKTDRPRLVETRTT